MHREFAMSLLLETLDCNKSYALRPKVGFHLPLDKQLLQAEPQGRAEDEAGAEVEAEIEGVTWSTTKLLIQLVFITRRMVVPCVKMQE